MIDFQLAVKKIQELAVERKLYCDPSELMLPGIESSAISRDGRTLKRLVRELTEDGYLTGAVKESGNYVYTTKAYDEIVAAEPNLIDLWEGYVPNVIRALRAVPWNAHGMTLENKKFLIENKDRYKFFVGYPIYYERNAQAKSGMKLFVPNDNYKEVSKHPDFKGRYSHDLLVYVTSQQLVDHSKSQQRESAIQRAMRNNLTEGLKHLGLVPATTEDFLAVDETPHLFGGGSKVQLKEDPSTWDTSLDNAVNHSLAKIAALTTRLQNLYALQRSVQKYGGWEKVLADHKAWIASEYDRIQADFKDTTESVEAEPVEGNTNG